MATTRLIAMHRNKGKTVAQCLRERTAYAMNPDKTEDGALVTAYGCHAETADKEFALMHREYLRLTGRERKDEVLAYQLRQSFKPGEVTPEEANRIGCELAERFLKGEHAYIVATHTGSHCIHNHIVLSAVSLDCTHKFRNFFLSGKALARLSDQICMEHKLSIITDPKHKGQTYDKWQGNQIRPSNRDRLREAIDMALMRHPDGFDALMRILQEAGWEIKRGKQISLRAPAGKRFMRMDTLGEEYSEEALRAVLSGERQHKPKRPRGPAGKVNLLIDIQARMAEGKGPGYQRWASVFNLKQMAASMLYLHDHGIMAYEDL